MALLHDVGKIGVDDAEHLNRAIANLERIQGIYEIKRVIH